jgi:hypothetical protein
MSPRSVAVIILVVLLVLILMGNVSSVRAEDPPEAKFPPQENPDTFMYQGQSLDLYNRHSADLRLTGVWRWRWERNPQCAGDLRPRFLEALENLSLNFPIQFIEAPDGHLVRQSCGQELIRKCASETINCLPDGYPYNLTIYLASISTTYQIVTAVSISLHEMFHALCTWGEQYRRTSDGGFAASQDQTVMNVGPLSRHLIGQLEIDRWNRSCGARSLKNVGQGSFGPDFQYVYYCGALPANTTRVSVLYRDGSTTYWSGIFMEPGVDANGCRGARVWTVPGRVVLLKAENAVDWKTNKTEVVAGRF